MEMELRYIVICGEQGLRTKPLLQYKDEHDEWEYVPSFKIKEGDDDTISYL